MTSSRVETPRRCEPISCWQVRRVHPSGLRLAYRHRMHQIDDVVARGMCVGCGACGVATSGAIPVTLGPYKVYQADLSGTDEEVRQRASKVCPFADNSANEDTLDAPTPNGRAFPKDPFLGRVGSVYLGRRNSGAVLDSSSGGLTSWLLEQLLENGMVDGVIHVGKSDQGLSEHFAYGVADATSDLIANKKSFYYATTLERAISSIRGDGKTYAIVGIPCFITAARHLANSDDALSHQLRFFVGLVCGHLKSQFFAESFGWQMGIHPDELAEIDFRRKNEGRTVGDYDTGARRIGTSEFVTERTHNLVGGNWGQGAFQPEACNFCDDIFAETADVAFGDAWLPEFDSEWRGTNVVVCRNTEIDELFRNASSSELTLNSGDIEEAISSQAGNFRHRRDGLKVRLADDIRAGLSVPVKRVTPGYDHVSARRRRLIRHRREMSVLSLQRFYEARKANDLSLYIKPAKEAWAKYRRIETPVWLRFARTARAWLRGRLKRRNP